MGDVRIVLNTVRQVFFRKKGLEDSDADEVEITDDLGDYLLKAGKVTKEEYDERQAQARELLAAGRSGSV